MFLKNHRASSGVKGSSQSKDRRTFSYMSGYALFLAEKLGLRKTANFDQFFEFFLQKLLYLAKSVI